MAYLGTIRVDHHNRAVEWVMTAREARDLADAIEEAVSTFDLARQDAADLRSAANQLDGEDEA